MLFSTGFYVILPYFTLRAANQIFLSTWGELDYQRLNIDDVLFFILSLGIINAGLAFAKGSSPKYSKRKACFSLLAFGGSGAYLYIIKFSGLSQIPIILNNLGTLTVTFTLFVYMVSGIVVMNAFLAFLDIFIAVYEQHDKTVYSCDEERKLCQAAELEQEGATE
ncbi:MAG TPA: hypothetical protein VKM55_22050 [Candidatus Lokiarchaeia archaeon]|nr:hypothetical protein [Candidatus Lokiarchaeia archaeon]